MKFKPNTILFSLWLALALLPALRAEDSPPAPPVETKQPAVAPKAADADQPAPPPAASEAVKPTAPDAAVAAKADDKAAEPVEESAEKPEETDATPAVEPAPADQPHHNSNRRHGDNPRISIIQDAPLAAGEQADALVSIFGSSTSAGDVANAVVSVIGTTRITGGTVGDAAVAVLGNVYVNGHVKGEVVAVLGNVELGPDAVVDGQIVCVGGELKRDPKAVTHGSVQNVAIGGRYFNFDGLHAWFTQCLLYGRPLAFGEHLMWAWWIALAYLGFYALVALVAPGGVMKCVETLEERPGKSILAGVLALLLTPVAFLLLAITLFIGIGFALIPVFSLGLFFAGLFGKVVMLAWLGSRLTKLLGDGPLAKPVFSVLVGGVIVLLLYTVPILGFVVYKLLGVLGLGVVLYTLILYFKSSRAAAAAASAALGSSVPPPVGDMSSPPPIPSLPPVISAATLPRAGFWRRIGAVLLDVIMFGIVFGILHDLLGSLLRGGGSFPLWFALYNIVMWATKGTTIGGIVCGLKLVRLDDRPMDWSVAIVRSLGAFLSLAVAGLGFIWVAFDDDRQSWHDKIAGTTIVKVPKGTSLL